MTIPQDSAEWYSEMGNREIIQAQDQTIQRLVKALKEIEEETIRATPNLWPKAYRNSVARMTKEALKDIDPKYLETVKEKD